MYTTATEGTYETLDFNEVNNKQVLVKSGGDTTTNCGVENTDKNGCLSLEAALTAIYTSTFSYFKVTLSGKSGDTNAWKILTSEATSGTTSAAVTKNMLITGTSNTETTTSIASTSS